MVDLSGRQFGNILIVKLSAIGDVTMATPFPRGLKMLYPEARIDWLVEPLSADVLRGNPFINEVIVWERCHSMRVKGLKGAWGLVRDLRELAGRIQGRYDLAIDLQGLARSGLAVRASGAAVRLGKKDSREGSGWFLTHKADLEAPFYRASEQYIGILRRLGLSKPPQSMEIYPDADNVAKADALLASAGVSSEYAVLTPATTRPYKHWSDEAFAQTIVLLERELGLTSVLLGSPKDREMANRIMAMSGESGAVSLAGETTLRDAAEIIRRARLLVGVDTGLMHFGIAMGTPTIAVFGPTTAQRLRDEPNTRVLQRAGPRRTDNTINRKQWWDDRSIDQNTPEDVIRVACELLGKGATKTA